MSINLAEEAAFGANAERADEDALIPVLERRDATPAGDRLTVRMHARYLIDTLDAVRAARPNNPEATIAALAADLERHRVALEDACADLGLDPGEGRDRYLAGVPAVAA